MKLLHKRMPDTFDLYLLGDSHEGNRAQHTNGVENAIHEIADSPSAFFVHMGDECDAVASDDKRYKHETTSQPIPLQQAIAVAKQFEPAKRKCVAWLNGNHNEKLARMGNLTRDVVCAKLGVPYGSWTCKLRLDDSRGRQMFKLYLTHGFRGTFTSNAKDHEQRIANMKAALKMRLSNKACDCLIMAMGHTHKLMVVDPAKRLIMSDDGEHLRQNYLMAGDGRADYIEPDRRWYANTGSFLRTFIEGEDGYAEVAGYDPVELGYVVVRVRDRAVVSVKPITIG